MKESALAKRRQRSTNKAAFIFLLPVMLIMCVFIFYPIVDSFRISTLNWNGISADTTFIGLDNWVKLIQDKSFWLAFKNNIIIMVCSIIIQIPIGLAEATFIEFVGKIIFVFVFIPQFEYLAVIFCEPVIWVVMTLYLVYCLFKDPVMLAGKNIKKR